MSIVRVGKGTATSSLDLLAPEPQLPPPLVAAWNHTAPVSGAPYLCS